MSDCFVCLLVDGSSFRCLFKFGVKGRRVACQNGADGVLPSLFVGGCIVANETPAAYAAHDTGTEADAIQFQAFCLFARASHNRNVFPAIGVNLRGRRSSVSPLDGFVRNGVRIHGSWQNTAVYWRWLVIAIRLLQELQWLKLLLLLWRRWRSIRPVHGEWYAFVVLRLSFKSTF